MLADTLKKTTDLPKLLGRLYFHLVANEDYAYETSKVKNIEIFF
jgi:hypothetical protein